MNSNKIDLLDSLYRIKNGLKILDQIENSKLRLLVNRICQSLQSDVSDNIFSAEEEEKLLVSLSLEKTELATLLQTITSIYSRAAFHLVKPSVVETSMKEHFSIGDDKVAILSHAWITHSEGIIDTLKQKSIFPSKVNNEHFYSQMTKEIINIYFLKGSRHKLER